MHTKKAPKRVGLSHPSIVPYGCFTTKDNKKILFSIQNEREWSLLEQNILRLPESLKIKFNNPSNRLKNKNKLNNIIKNNFKKNIAKDICKILKKNRIAFGYLNSIEDFSRHSQLKTSKVALENRDISFIPPVSLKKRLRFKKIPKLGEHSNKIRREFD